MDSNGAGIGSRTFEIVGTEPALAVYRQLKQLWSFVQSAMKQFRSMNENSSVGPRQPQRQAISSTDSSMYRRIRMTIH